MQWLIDIVKAWIESEGYIKMSYIDRGDPRTPDFDVGSFTLDLLWHDLDLSGIIPGGTKTVLIATRVKNSIPSSYFALRKKGQSFVQNQDQIITQEADTTIERSLIVVANESGIVQYRGSSEGWSKISLAVRGWWL